MGTEEEKKRNNSPYRSPSNRGFSFKRNQKGVDVVSLASLTKGKRRMRRSGWQYQAAYQEGKAPCYGLPRARSPRQRLPLPAMPETQKKGQGTRLRNCPSPQARDWHPHRESGSRKRSGQRVISKLLDTYCHCGVTGQTWCSFSPC